MKYDPRFKPWPPADLERLPADVGDELMDYLDLQELRAAKQGESEAPTLSLDEVKTELDLP